MQFAATLATLALAFVADAAATPHLRTAPPCQVLADCTGCVLTAQKGSYMCVTNDRIQEIYDNDNKSYATVADYMAAECPAHDGSVCEATATATAATTAATPSDEEAAAAAAAAAARAREEEAATLALATPHLRTARRNEEPRLEVCVYLRYSDIQNAGTNTMPALNSLYQASDSYGQGHSGVRLTERGDLNRDGNGWERYMIFEKDYAPWNWFDAYACVQTLNENAKTVRIDAKGGDAMNIDDFEIEFRRVTGYDSMGGPWYPGPQTTHSIGAHNDIGWCLSTDANDHKDWGRHAVGNKCFSCLELAIDTKRGSVGTCSYSLR